MMGVRGKLGTVKENNAMFLARRKNEKMETMIEKTLKGRSDNVIEWMIRRKLKAQQR